MITKQKAAALVAVLLTTIATALYKCDDTSPVVPSIPVAGAADAGVYD